MILGVTIPTGHTSHVAPTADSITVIKDELDELAQSHRPLISNLRDVPWQACHSGFTLISQENVFKVQRTTTQHQVAPLNTDIIHGAVVV